jgi:putative membrane protein insertion efficiency factor
MMNLVRHLWQLPRRALVGVVRVYQWTLSPLLGRRCRFEPSCSEYFILAVQKYGAIWGSIRGAGRICRCHPFHPGGWDPP